MKTGGLYLYKMIEMRHGAGGHGEVKIRVCCPDSEVGMDVLIRAFKPAWIHPRSPPVCTVSVEPVRTKRFDVRRRRMQRIRERAAEVFLYWLASMLDADVTSWAMNGELPSISVNDPHSLQCALIGAILSPELKEV